MKLLPCPFCGKVPTIRVLTSPAPGCEDYSECVIDCNCKDSPFLAEDRDELIEKWNTRGIALQDMANVGATVGKIYKEAYDKEYRFLMDEYHAYRSEEPHLPMEPGTGDGIHDESDKAGFVAVVEYVALLTKSLKDHRKWITDGAFINFDGVPEHECEYSTNPESGHCSFHEMWVTGAELLGEKLQDEV